MKRNKKTYLGVAAALTAAAFNILAAVSAEASTITCNALFIPEWVSGFSLHKICVHLEIEERES